MKSHVFSMQSFEEVQFLEVGHFELAYFTMACPTSSETNEDSIAFSTDSKANIVLAVADGAGGHPTGEEASHRVVSAVCEKVEKEASTAGLRNSILDGLEMANQQLIDLGTGSKSTATICEVSNGQLRVYQVGDSGAVVCGQKGKLKYKTVFHSRAGYGVEAGLIEEEEALREPDLNEVANIVGDREMAIEIGPVISLDEKDTILVASDGLFDNLIPEEIIEIIRAGSLVESSQQLVQFFNDRLETDPKGLKTKYDDTSFLLCRVAFRN